MILTKMLKHLASPQKTALEEKMAGRLIIPVDLAEDLAGQEILGDFADGGGNNISDKMGDKTRYGENGSHDKVTGSKTHSDGTKTEVHGDRDRKTGELSDTKFKDAPDNAKSRNELYKR